ncbi:hypothetical protein SGRIM119S_08559 [Streptomyces griseorubiginosus]
MSAAEPPGARARPTPASNSPRSPSGAPRATVPRTAPTGPLAAGAEYACDAGRIEEAGEAAGAVLTESDSAHRRVRARLILLRNAGQALRARAT